MSSVILVETSIQVEDLVTDEPPLYGPVDHAHFAYVTRLTYPLRASVIPAGTAYEVQLPKKAHRDGSTGSNRASLSRVQLTVLEDIGLKDWLDPCLSVSWRTDSVRHLLMQYWLHLVEIRHLVNGRPDEPVDTL
jgi:hypothetical protein